MHSIAVFFLCVRTEKCNENHIISTKWKNWCLLWAMIFPKCCLSISRVKIYICCSALHHYPSSITGKYGYFMLCRKKIKVAYIACARSKSNYVKASRLSVYFGCCLNFFFSFNYPIVWSIMSLFHLIRITYGTDFS